MAHFPTEIVADILSRLPVEPILRFRCVSKLWCALIDSPDFIKSHLKRSIETKNNRSLILRGSSSIYSTPLYSLDVAVELDHPFKNCYEDGPDISGSCDGLVLVHNAVKDDIAIWNPSTRKHQILPSTADDTQSSDKFMDNLVHFHGIGYDSVHDDYKVVKMTQLYDEASDTSRSEVKVYSLKSNTWGNTMNFPCYISLDGSYYGMFAGGALNWVASETDGAFGDDRVIAAFDLATEEYRSVPMPNFGREECPFHMEVAVLEGCLCILRKYRDTPFDVWVMKEYGVRESWTKLLSAPEARDIQLFHYAIPLAFSVDGAKVLLLQDHSKLIWFDLKCKVVDSVNIRGLPKICQAEFYTQSLVPIGRGGGRQVKKKRREENKEKKPKETGKKRDGFLSEGFKLKL